MHSTFFFLPPSTGISSVGKSALLESIVLQTGHQLLSTASGSSSDGGCGRFMVGSKNVIIFHDCNISVLTGVDLVSPLSPF